MNDITKHQLEIMAAMMHGKRVLTFESHMGKWIAFDQQQTLQRLVSGSMQKVAPDQDDVTVRMTGGIEPNFQGMSRGAFHDLWCFGEHQTDEDKYYIDINQETGSITGGKL